MSNRATELLQEIAAAESEKQAQRESDPDKRIAQARAELAELNQQQRRANLAADIQANQQYIAANQQTIDDFLQQLTNAVRLIDAISKPPFSVDASYDRQQRFVSDALAKYGEGWNNPAQLARLNSQNYLEQEAARNEQRQDYLAAESRFADGAPLWLVLMNWIHQSRTPAERQLRQGITFSYVGQLYDPGQDFDYEAQAREIASSWRRRYSRGL